MVVARVLGSWGRVNAVDIKTKTRTCASSPGEVQLAHDRLVFAFGNRAHLDYIPGLADHSLPLKTSGDALEIRNAVVRKYAQDELAAFDARASV